MNDNAKRRDEYIQPEEVIKKMSELRMNSTVQVQPNENGGDDIFKNPELDEELKHFNVDDVILKYMQGVKGS
jgi:hypothetical protein